MASEAEYKNKIQSYDWIKLEELWQQIQERNTPNFESGKALEYLILRMFELEKAEVCYPYSVSNVEQIDGVIYTQNIACIIECKDKVEPLNFEPIAKLRSQLMRHPISVIGSLFSMSGITQPALKLLDTIQPQTILIWEKAEINYCLKNKDFCTTLLKKYRAEVEYGGYGRYNVSFDINGESE